MSEVWIANTAPYSVCQGDCWNFDKAARTLQCFSQVTGNWNDGTQMPAAPAVSPYFDAGINFYIKSMYLFSQGANANINTLH